MQISFVKVNRIWSRIACVVLLANLMSTAFAQSNIQSLSPNVIMSSEASFLNPAYLSRSKSAVMNIFPLVGMNTTVTNDVVPVGLVLKYVRQLDSEAKPNFAPIHAIMDHLGEENELSVYNNLTLVHLVMSMSKADNPLRLGLSLRQNSSLSIKFNDEFFKLIYGGNKQFAGRSARLNAEIEALGYVDLGLALSKSFDEDEAVITPGIRFRYLKGLGALFMDDSAIDFYTEANGEYVELSGQVDGYTGGTLNINNVLNNRTGISQEDLFNLSGNGAAIDLGLTMQIKRFSFAWGWVDNGFLVFKKNDGRRFHSKENKIRWDGYNMFEENKGETSGSGLIDFKEFMKLESEESEIRMRLVSKHSLNANFGLSEMLTKDEKTVFRHNFGASYIAWTDSREGHSDIWWGAVYYQYNHKDVVTFGVNYNTFRSLHNLGANFGVRIPGFMHIGIGSNSILATFDKTMSRQVDFFLNMGFTL